MNRIIPQPFIGTGNISRPQDAPSQSGMQPSVVEQYKAPHKAQDNYIPSSDLLNNMITRALEARDKGVYWDRGSILNIVV